MAWESKTKKFLDNEIRLMETLTVEELALMIANSSPVVALRVLAEIMMNNDADKLNCLLQYSIVNQTWQAWHQGWGTTQKDAEYATQMWAALSDLKKTFRKT